MKGPANKSGCRSGFTLVEVLLAMTISSLLVLSIVGAARSLAGARERVDRQTGRLMEARHGLQDIVCSLRNVRRDFNRREPAVLGDHEAGEMGSDRINLLVVSDRRSRPDGAESDQYEVSYYLWKPAGQMLPCLMCRKDHALDDYPEEGGMASVVAEGVVGLRFEYFNGTDWQKEWSELELEWPEAVRVTIAVVETEVERTSKPPEPMVLSTVVPIHMERPMGMEKPAEGTQEGGR